jgi:hypothetical protein
VPFSPLTLSRFVDVYDLYQRIDGRHFRRVGLSHYYAVLPLPRREQEIALIAASGQHWPATKLAAIVKRWLREQR